MKGIYFRNFDNSQKRRLVYLDAIKILAAFLTVFYHFSYYKLDYGYNAGLGGYLPNLTRVIMCFAASCVPLFFIVNGALMLSKERSWKNVYMKAAKIAVLTVVWSFVGFPRWFFETLIILYILFPLFQYAYIKARWIYRAILAAVLIMPFIYNFLVLIFRAFDCGYVVSIFSNEIVLSDLRVTGMFTMYSIEYFLLGPILNKEDFPVGLGISMSIIGWIYVVVETTIYTNLNGAVYDGVNGEFPTIGALLLSVGIFIVIKGMPLNGIEKVIVWTSDTILPIYLLHMFIINLFNKFIHIGKIGLTEAIMCTVCIVIICTVIAKILNKIPIVCALLKV